MMYVRTYVYMDGWTDGRTDGCMHACRDGTIVYMLVSDQKRPLKQKREIYLCSQATYQN